MAKKCSGLQFGAACWLRLKQQTRELLERKRAGGAEPQKPKHVSSIAVKGKEQQLRSKLNIHPSRTLELLLWFCELKSEEA